MKSKIVINDIEVTECQELGETIDGYTCGTPQRICLGDEYIYRHTLCSDNPFCQYKELWRAHSEIKKLEKELLEYKFLFEKAKEFKEEEAKNLREENEYLKRALNFLQDKTGEIYGE